MAEQSTINKVKMAMRITSDAFDAEINDLIASALADLGLVGIERLAESDAIIRRAIITFCKLHFGTTGDYGNYELLKKSYDEQKAQLKVASGYIGDVRE